MTDSAKDLKSKVAERRLDGLYKQRGDNDSVIVRVRGPGSRWSSEKLRVLTRLAREFGDEKLHITTRGDILLNGVPFDDVDDVLSVLAEAGMSTRGACGDCPRNITACPGAGVCPNELIDTCTLAEELSEELAGVAAYEHLPRKFKVSISGCQAGCALPQIQDVGLVARRMDETELTSVGFEVYLAGGLGRHPMLAKRAPVVLRPDNVLLFVRAAVDCFNDLGDRKPRHRARLKFVADRIGHQELLGKIKERIEGQAWAHVI